MSISLPKLTGAIDSLLKPAEFRDYCPNGLQIEGCAEVGKIVTGVTASQEFIEAAIKAEADAILVHHGYFWSGENPVLKGIKKRRIKIILDNDISLLAYHLPLDAHPLVGNNAQLGLLLDFNTEGQLDPKHKSKVGVWGSLKNPCTAEQLISRLTKSLGREPFHVPGKADEIKSIGWCTGSAQNAIELAYEQGVDAYLTGEVSEQTVHFARETGIHFFAAGHHATERYGVQALGNYLSQEHDIEHQFIDIDNPV